MKKVILSALLVAGSLVGAKAQSVHFGLKAGANFSKLTDLDNAKTKAGFYGGAFVNLGLGKTWAIQPEVLYSAQGVASGSGDTKEKLNLGYIAVPVMVQYNIAESFYVEAGPQISILASAKDKFDGKTEDIKDQVKSADFGAAIGCGFKFTKHIGVNARYIFGLSDVTKKSDAVEGVDQNKPKNSVAQVGLFYQF